MTRSLLTYDQVAGWRTRLEQIAQEERNLAAEKRDIERKLEAVAILVDESDFDWAVEDEPTEHVMMRPPLVDATKPPATKSSKPKPTWPSEVLRVFEEERRPMTFQMLRELIDKGPLHGEYEKSEKGFYHAVGRLQKKGNLKKHRGWLFLPDDLRDHLRKVEAGEVEDVKEVTSQHRSPMGEEIKAHLEDHPEGMTSGDMIAHLKKDERFVDTLTKNATGAYNVIARLAKRGEIRKEGRTIYPLQGNEPPEGGSETEEAPTSSDQSGRGSSWGPLSQHS